jgi:anaerobic dimethyl sulfoxide reductase subunit B (iron-sulfur subunit)
MAFYFDQARCLGCYTCAVACKDWHNIEAGPAHWRRITSKEWGKYPKVFLSYLSLSCNHCENPACAEACPQEAISKEPSNGIVQVDPEQCLGGDDCARDCWEACPYDAPQFGKEENPKMQMCTFCADRWEENKPPICVEACPMRALDAGPIEELREKYGNKIAASDFVQSKKTNPSILFKLRYP